MSKQIYIFTRFVLFFLGLFLSCTIVKAQDVPVIRIDPAQAYGGPVSQYFEQIEYIPLETTKESMLGETHQLCVTDSSYVVVDYDTRSVLFFKKNGLFISKIQFRDTEFPSMSYDAYRKVIVINVHKADHTLEMTTYNSRGHLLSEKKVVDKKNLPSHLLPLGDNRFLELNTCGGSTSEKIVPLISIFINDSLHKNYLPFDPIKKFGFCKLAGRLHVSNFSQNGIYYASLPLIHSVYSISKDTVMELFQFVFPQNRSCDSKILKSTDSKYLDSIDRVMRNSTTNIFAVHNIFYKQNLLFFKTMARVYSAPRDGSESELQYNFIYDTASGRLTSLERLTPDSASYFLPVLGYVARTKGLIIDSSNVYSSVSSLGMFTAHQKTKNRNPQYPPALQQYFKTQNRKSNPVIVRMKLRE